MGQKILVVEDNELNLKLFCDLLRAHGYETEPVRDGREALDRARAFVPDLVVMDIQMPYVSGLELIEQMKSDDGLKQTPIMAVTAYAAKGDEERIRDAGAEGYVSKPISVVKFVEAVAGLLAVAAARPIEPAGRSEVPAEEPALPELPPSETVEPEGSDAVAVSAERARSIDPAEAETELPELPFEPSDVEAAGGAVECDGENQPTATAPEVQASSAPDVERDETEDREEKPDEGPAPAT